MGPVSAARPAAALPGLLWVGPRGYASHGAALVGWKRPWLQNRQASINAVDTIFRFVLSNFLKQRAHCAFRAWTWGAYGRVVYGPRARCALARAHFRKVTHSSAKAK